MPKNQLQINVGFLVEGAEGDRLEFDIDEKIRFEEKNAPLTLRIKAKITVMKLERELNVVAENLETAVELVCSRCLKKFEHKIKIPFIERQFLFERPREAEDLADTYLVDMKNMTIDLTELFRQEILLHFPFVPLCSIKCRGLCHVCGYDLNEGSCGHPQAAPRENKPMSHLKELFNRSSYGETASNKEKSSAKPNKKKI